MSAPGDILAPYKGLSGYASPAVSPQEGTWLLRRRVCEALEFSRWASLYLRAVRYVVHPSDQPSRRCDIMPAEEHRAPLSTEVSRLKSKAGPRAEGSAHRHARGVDIELGESAVRIVPGAV